MTKENRKRISIFNVKIILICQYKTTQGSALYHPGTLYCRHNYCNLQTACDSTNVQFLHIEERVNVVMLFEKWF